jgi:NADH:ubiquinone oxidoreductase subunit 5 (subunit L)/multisubunit Na+/H+ antiporter MnhA subunit
MEFLVVLIPLFPLLAAFFIGVGSLLGQINGEADESTTSSVATGAITLSCILSLLLLSADLFGKNASTYSIGQWLSSDSFEIQAVFITSGFNTVITALFAVLLFIVTRFSINYMHREAGFHRYFFILSLFSAAMLLLVLAGNAVITFIGWEIAGLCSYLLIGYAYDRQIPTVNATRVFVTNRIGDASFVLGIGLSYFYVGTINWGELNAMAEHLTMPTVTVIALCFAVAAFAKSAQLPFSPWLARAMEGPTPSSAIFYGAVMIHAGVFLIIMLQPLFEQAPFVMVLLAIVGFATAVYSFIVGFTQTDIKSSFSFAISGQLGLMLLECGLGWWELAAWHLCAHAVVRCYQVLTAPSLMHNVLGNPIKPVGHDLKNLHWLYIASVQRFWLDPIADRTLARPIQGLGQDLDYFDSYVVDRAMGDPTLFSRSISTLTQLEQKVMSAEQHDYNLSQYGFGRGNGVAGKLMEWIGNIFGWFEERLVIQAIGMNIVDLGRKIGQAANTFEELMLKPRYLVLFVFVVLLIAATR